MKGPIFLGELSAMDHIWLLLPCSSQRLQLRANVKSSVLMLLMMFGELSF